MSPTDAPKNPLWDMFEYFLGQQIIQSCAMCDPKLSLDDDALAEMLPVLMDNLSCGRTQKEMYRIVAPSFDPPQRYAVFAELCSWMFATEGVMSKLYRPLLSQYATETTDDSVDGATGRVSPNEHTRFITQQSELLRLPSELLDIILENLPAQDINDLRLTCQQARMRTFPFWSKAFFSAKQFMIDEYSLQTLVDISSHPQLSRVLIHLIIGVDEINTKDTLALIRNCYTKNPAKVPQRFQYWRDAASAQQALLHTGRAIDLLSTAISQLPNLEAVSVSGSKVFRYTPWYSQIFQYPDLGMRSYGSSAYQTQDRYSGSGMPNSQGFVDRVFNVVSTSLARSKPRIATLRTRLSRGDEVLEHLADEAFDLPPLTSLHNGAAAVLGGLSELHLDINLESAMLHSVDDLADHTHAFGPCNIGLRRFLAFACNLQSLTLDVWGGATSEGHCDFMAWLCEPAGRLLEDADKHDENAASTPDTSIAWMVPPIALPSLRRLVLKGFYMSPDQLRALFKKFDTLKSAALLGVYLRRCLVDDPPVPEDSDEIENFWAEFFRHSTTTLSKLESLDLENLAVMQHRQDPDSGVCVTPKDMDVVVFVPTEGSAGPPPNSRTVTDFSKDALKRLADETWLARDWLPASDSAETDD